MRGWGRCNFESGGTQRSPYRELREGGRAAPWEMGVPGRGNSQYKAQRLAVLVEGAAKKSQGLEGGQDGRWEESHPRKGVDRLFRALETHMETLTFTPSALKAMGGFLDSRKLACLLHLPLHVLSSPCVFLSSRN